jgi:cobalt-zinc-cadmium efflux system outer membrane protein
MRRSFSIAALALAGAALFAGSARAEAALTLGEAERRALSQESVAQLMAARRRQADGAVSSAATWPNPEFTASRESVDLAGATSRERFYWLHQKFDISGERGLRKKAARQEATVTEAEIASLRRDIRLRVRERFFAALYQQQRLARITHWREELRRVIDHAEKRHRAGDISAYDVVRLQRAASSFRTQADTARARHARALSELAALIGQDASEPPAALAGTLAPEALPPLDSYLRRLPQLPELQALQAQADAHRLTAEAEKRAVIPDITIGAGYKELREGGRRFDGSLLSLGFRIPLFDRNQGRRASAEAAAEAQAAEGRIALAQMRGEVIGRWRELRELQRNASRFARDNQASSRALLQAAEAAYNAAEIGALELVDAYRNVLDADLRLLTLRERARSASIALQRLTPGDTK